jgi:hypothetical protein
MLPQKIYSKLLGEEIWMVADQVDLHSLASEGVLEAIYIGWEIILLKEMSKEIVKAVHLTKKTFRGSIIAKTPSGGWIV